MVVGWIRCVSRVGINWGRPKRCVQHGKLRTAAAQQNSDRPSILVGGMSQQYTALTRAQRQDIRASQRTFEGAYIRTALAQLTFGTVILRLFRREFLPVGTVYVASAVLFIALAHVQRVLREKPLIEMPSTVFRTSGEIIALASILSLGSYISLFVLILRQY